MMVNKHMLIIITLILTFITNYILKLSFVTGGIVTLAIVILGYIIYVNYRQGKRYALLEEDLDPEAFIEATHRTYKNAGNDKQLNSLLNSELAFGYISLGEFETAMEFLHKVEAKYLPRINKFILVYYNALIIVYSNLEEYDKLEEIYKLVEKYEVKGDLAERLMNILMANKYFCEGNYLESAKMFESYPKDKMSKRLELEILFNLASIDEKEGNIKEAVLKYERVEKEGNKLYIVELAKKSLDLIER